MNYVPKCSDCHKRIPTAGTCPTCKVERRRMAEVRRAQYAMRKPEDRPVIAERVERYSRIVALGVSLFE